ncbi:vacuolar protein sorting-associated protein 13A-like [Senna tora]|uniref:Vacuolar protein sorting-associated protein 13A-like n=1 Tax=Senna tora TaxID=362788 RepID=A0A834SUF3_9FABA|nr:vacuolar protein sorting-associated protein 13A-like [Senna tora]
MFSRSGCTIRSKSGVRLDKLSAVTIDDIGKETFIMGGALDPFKSEIAKANTSAAICVYVNVEEV